MDQDLIDFIEQLYALADTRNLALYNPVTCRLPLVNNTSIIVVFSFKEPDYRSYPFNVVWVPSDPESEDYKKVLRRQLKVSADGYNDTWVALTTLASVTAEAQFWDSSSDNTFLLGELGVAEVLPATTTRLGIAVLNIAPAVSGVPVVVDTADPRMSDARTPTAHTHPLEPFTRINGQSSGATTVLIQGAGPTSGQVLRITGVNPQDSTEFYASWVTLHASDIAYAGPSFDSLTITGSNSVNESNSSLYQAVAHFSDNSSQTVTASWSIIAGASYASVNGSGLVTTQPVSANQLVTLRASYTFTQTNTTHSVDKVISIVDTTLYPASVAIQGSTTMNENSQQTFVAMVTYTNGTSAARVATWSRQNSSAGSINPNSGLYTSASVVSDVTDTISVTYTEASITVTDTLDITVVNVPVTFTSITITGNSSVNENGTSQYSVTGNFSDGSTQNLSANTTWSISVGGSHASIDSTGLLTTNNVSANQSVTISASTTDPGTGTTRTGTKVITVVNVLPKPVYGKGSENDTADTAFITSTLTSQMSNSNSGNTFTLNLGAGQWGWYAMPASFGTATFTDTSNNFQGGWDGATWPNGSPFSTNTGPQSVTHLGETWLLYRTDYSELGNITFRVDF